MASADGADCSLRPLPVEEDSGVANVIESEREFCFADSMACVATTPARKGLMGLMGLTWPCSRSAARSRFYKPQDPPWNGTNTQQEQLNKRCSSNVEHAGRFARAPDMMT